MCACSPFPGADQSEAQLLGPNRQILGPSGMCAEDSPRGAEDSGPLQAEQGDCLTRVITGNDEGCYYEQHGGNVRCCPPVLPPAGGRRGRVRPGVSGEAVDQDRPADGLRSGQSYWLAPTGALRESPLPLQSVSERS